MISQSNDARDDSTYLEDLPRFTQEPTRTASQTCWSMAQLYTMPIGLFDSPVRIASPGATSVIFTL